MEINYKTNPVLLRQDFLSGIKLGTLRKIKSTDTGEVYITLAR